jgi:hypothetical protein
MTYELGNKIRPLRYDGVKNGRTSIAWLKERISLHYTMAKETETERGKHSILPPAPKQSFLDSTPNRIARTIAQIGTGHWLCAPYLKRIRMDTEEQVSDQCWWCEHGGCLALMCS